MCSGSGVVVDPALVEKILDVPQRKRDTDVQHHRQGG
jgi:hypothetical protein